MPIALFLVLLAFLLVLERILYAYQQGRAAAKRVSECCQWANHEV
jgi:hypothetical protein